MNACARCGSAVTAVVEDFPYTGCGFKVVLSGITVYRCAACGACAPSIPNVIGLHRAILRILVTKAQPLGPSERKFVVAFLQNEHVKASPFVLALARHWPLRGARFAEYVLRAMALSHLDEGESGNQLLVSASELVHLWPREETGGRPTRWSRGPGASVEIQAN